jgi:hypothetical protein
LALDFIPLLACIGLFFSRQPNFMQGTGNSPIADLTFPQLRHLLLGFIAGSFGKLTELCPVCNFVAMDRRTVGVGLKVSGLSFTIEP